MNKMVISFLIAAFPLYCQSAEELILLGTIPLNCHPVIPVRGELKVPEEFSIGPEAAIDIAVEKSDFKCNSKLEQELYHDNTNYYIIKSIYAPVLDKAPAIMVNGRTGAVSMRSQQ